MQLLLKQQPHIILNHLGMTDWLGPVFGTRQLVYYELHALANNNVDNLNSEQLWFYFSKWKLLLCVNTVHLFILNGSQKQKSYQFPRQCSLITFTADEVGVLCAVRESSLIKIQINLLKPTGHVMHQQFNIQ